MNKQQQQQQQTKQAAVDTNARPRLSVDKTSTAGANAKSEMTDRTPKYQNTYRLDSFRPFDPEVADKIVRDIMESKLSLLTTYQPDQISRLSMEISTELIRAIGKRDYDRYKLVAQVSIIQRLHQSIQSAFECFWDMNRDNYSYYVFGNCHVYAWCCLFGLYYE